MNHDREPDIGPPDPGIPSRAHLAQNQTLDAELRLSVPRTSYLRWPWDGVHRIAGMIPPSELWIVAARTGQGKTTFLLDWFDRMVTAGRPMLFVGLEQTPHELRVKWACLRCGIPPKLVLAPSDEDANSLGYLEAVAKVEADLHQQRELALTRCAMFATARRVNRHRLREWTEWAVDHQAAAVVVDHVDRMDHGSGANSFHELSETIVFAKELAVRHEIAMILASQVGRPNGDPIQRFTPPALHELRGAGTKEEEANAVLTVFRPLRDDVGDEQFKRVRLGLLDGDAVYQHNVMAVRVLKHRLDGAQTGKQCLLSVDRGRLSDIPVSR